VVVPGTTWNLEVISRSPTEPVILTWPDVSRVPRGLRLRLVDLDTGRAVSLRTASHYTLSPGPDGVQCRLRIEAAAALNDRPLILQVQARPHRGGPATLEYTLSEAVDVRVRIGSVSGRPVRELAHPPGRAGLNAVVWDLRDDAGRPVPNGVYLCEVHAANTEQEQGQAVCVLEVRR
jgi:hypothetical protein